MHGSELPLHWDPLAATVGIWAGDSLDRLHFISNSLREVGIPSRSLTEDLQNLRLLVRPEDETNAREVVRQILEGAVPERSISPADDDIWRDEPVGSYLFAWLPTAVCLVVYILLDAFDSAWIDRVQWNSAFDPPFPLFSFVSSIGTIWMLYQAVRYEIRPWRFILLSFLPFSFVWYYFERYSRRRGYARLPIGVRERVRPRPSA